MNVWKNLVPGLFALAGVLFSVSTVISLLTGGPLNVTFLAIAPSFFALAIVFFAAGRKSVGGSRPPRG